MKLLRICGFIGLTLSILNALAAPSAGAYISDPQSEYTADQATEELKQPSNILCFISNTRPDAMVNQGTYVALVDGDKCDNEGQSSSSNSTNTGNKGTSSYTPVSLTVTRASSTAPQIIKGHVDLLEDEGNFSLPIYIHMTQSEAGSAAAPNGVLTFNYAAALTSSTTINGVSLPAGSMVVRGRIATSASGIEYAEKGGMGSGQTNDVRLYVNGNQTNGSGAISADYNGTSEDSSFIFGYNATHFCRSGTEYDSSGNQINVPEKCFKRSKDDAIKSVWRYGVYNADGSRYDLASPGFSVKDGSGDWGYASYWGIWFRNPPGNGASITHAKNGTVYTVLRGGGRLMKISRVRKTLDEIKNNKINFYNSQAGTGLLANTNYEGYWDAVAQNFKVVGLQSCDPTGCFSSVINPAIALTALEVAANNSPDGNPANSWGLWGWSQSLGSLSIPASTLNASSPGSEPNGIRYLTETLVKPGDTTVPNSLKCVQDCPTAVRMTAFVANPSNDPSVTSPFDATTINQWSGVATPLTYTWTPSTYQLIDTTSAEIGSVLFANMNSDDKTNLEKTNFKWGIRSGALVDATGSHFTSGGAMDCDGNGVGTTYCDYKASDLDEYYRFETGIQDWNTAVFLKNTNGSIVSFSSPVEASFQVPNESAYGQYAGASMNLQFQGFGDLHGIPGRCVNPYTNLEASCDADTKWFPAFSIADGTAITIDGSTKYVKWLDRELRFAPVAGTASSLGVTLGAASGLPAAITSTSCADTADTANPCNSSSANYPGEFSYEYFKKSPSVIHGVVQ
jgi:hypothetical protein